MDLHIMDIGPHIWAGSINKRAQIEGPIINSATGYRQLIIPSGGISFLFNDIYSYGYKDKMVFVADRYPAIKVGMYAGYKDDRPGNEEVENQKKLAEIILKDCGFEVLAEEGYEADDLIFSLCKKYAKDFNHIYVHTGDSDLYIVVNDKISVLPASSKGKYVTFENFPTTVHKSEIVPYNSLSFQKILFGDKSDHIPPLSVPLQQKLISAFCTDFYFPKMGNRELMRELISAFVPEALHQFDLVYPLPVDAEIDMYNEADLNKAAIWGNIVGNSKFMKPKIIPESITKMCESFFTESF